MYVDDGVIYADILFMINFSLDYLCLFIAGRLNKRGGRAWRLIIASAVGGAYTFLPLLFSGLTPWITVPAHLGAAVIICLIAFGRGCGSKRFWLTAVAFVLTEALMGGLVTGIYGLASQNGMYDGHGRWSFALICVISATLALIYGAVFRTGAKSRACEVRIFVDGEKINARLLVDSGNLVTEPFSALPVIVLSYTALPPPFDMPESGSFPRPIRAIPFMTGAGRSCLYGFRPDRIELIMPAKRVRTVEAYVGIDLSTVSYSGYDGLMPAELI